MTLQLLTVAALLSSAAQAVSAPRFAISCTGNAVFTDTIHGEPSTRRYPLPAQIYVIDETRRTVERALIPRQQFEPACGHGEVVNSVTFSPGLITARVEGPDHMCDLSINMATGSVTFEMHQDLAGGRYSRINFDMTCAAADIPVFDPSRNRF